MTKDEALKLALEALEGVLDDAPKVLGASISGGLYEVVQCREAITAIKEALAQPVQRPWVGLTDEEIKEIVGPWGDTPVTGYTRKLFDQIEAKLKEKNNG